MKSLLIEVANVKSTKEIIVSKHKQPLKLAKWMKKTLSLARIYTGEHRAEILRNFEHEILSMECDDSMTSGLNIMQVSNFWLVYEAMKAI